MTVLHPSLRPCHRALHCAYVAVLASCELDSNDTP